MTIKTDSEWFENWFDSKYYHILYQNRNYNEAELFIDNLYTFLKPQKGSIFLDLGCGKGRHSIYLNKKGATVTGMDLSPESIEHASLSSNDKLDFFVHDMRKVQRINYFDFVLNLFTSFGYFENDRDNYNVLKAVNSSLREGGTVVLDFMNAFKVLENLVLEEVKTLDGITFNISRRVEDGFIVKQIDFEDEGQVYSFQERVKALMLGDFEKYFSACGLKIVHLFGDYSLGGFDEKTSDRLIIIGVKKN